MPHSSHQTKRHLTGHVVEALRDSAQRALVVDAVSAGPQRPCARGTLGGRPAPAASLGCQGSRSDRAGRRTTQFFKKRNFFSKLLRRHCIHPREPRSESPFPVLCPIPRAAGASPRARAEIAVVSYAVGSTSRPGVMIWLKVFMTDGPCGGFATYDDGDGAWTPAGLSVPFTSVSSSTSTTTSRSRRNDPARCEVDRAGRRSCSAARGRGHEVPRPLRSSGAPADALEV